MSGPIPTRAREAIRRRDGGVCFRCGCGGVMDLHHRQRRREGGHGLANLIALCPGCHRWVHANPTEARRCGWIVSSLAAGEPAEIPARHYTGDYVLLDDDGGARWVRYEDAGAYRPY